MGSSKKILVINCGSSSLKYQLYLMPEGQNLVKGNVERIGEDKAFMTQKRVSDKKEFFVEGKNIGGINDHKVAFQLVIKAIIDKEYGVLGDIKEIDVVSHRVVQGGDRYSDAVVVDKKVISDIEELSDLAPLHNPPNLQGIKSAEEVLPGITQTVTFDTAFHQTMPDFSYRYAIPNELYSKFGLRKYGFHGTSHKYVAERVSQIIGKELSTLNIITCHLGNGASITAIKDGKSFDTSMGLTPLEGVVMGTRCGDIDASIVTFLCSKGYTPQDVNNILNKKSGLLGIFEKTNDMRDVIKASEEGDEKAKLALNLFVYRIKKYIGSYYATMGRVDLIVFTGGIGENSYKIRAKICQDMECLGLYFDPQANEKFIGCEGEISKSESKVKIFVVPTNEEYQIAKDAYRILF